MFSALLRPLALVSTIAFSTLGLLAQKYRRARFYFHLTLYLGTLGFMSVAGVFISLLATLVGQRFNINYLVARSFYYLASPLIGIRLNVEGRHHLTDLLHSRNGKVQSAVLVGNHQSFMDILYLGRIFPKRASIMAKRELVWAPLLGQYCAQRLVQLKHSIADAQVAASGAVFVDRKNRVSALSAMEKAGNDMKRRGISLWVFPEGTRSSSPTSKLLPFKKGAFHLAVQAQIPIIPVVCENYHRLFDSKTRMERGELMVKAISTTGLTSEDVNDLTERTREIMLETLQSISAPSQSSPPIANQNARATDSADSRAISSEVKAASSGDEPEEDAVEARSEGKTESRNGESTEDEMDEDAVLLRRPKKD